GKLPIKTALHYARQVAEALSAAHKQLIIHRDIKPDNIMVDNEGRIKVMDFGLAKFKNAGDITKTGDTLGTTAYMSPEQAKGSKLDHRTDIWSLGVVLYEMFGGRKPFLSEYPQAVIYSILNEEPLPLADIAPELPSDLTGIIHKALKKSVDERYQNVDEFLTDLNKLTEAEGLRTGYSGINDRKSGLKERMLSPVPAAAFIIVVIAAIGLLLFQSPDNIAFEERDWIMVTDFENRTNEEEFSQFLNTILEVGLMQSSYVNVYERQQIMNILASELEISGVKTLTPDVIRKAAEHRDVRVILIPTIKKENGYYVITSSIRNIESDATFEIEPVRAESKDAILKAMDKFSKQIRQVLGESPSSISDSYTPIVQATTSSLKALKLYAEGMKMKFYDESTGYDLIEQAAELDPEFALAHAELGMHFYINGNRNRGEEHFQKALDEMDRLSLRERLWIRSVVADWRGNREKAIENYKSYLSQYQDDYYAWWRLGYTYLITGQPENCVDAYSRVVEFNPNESSAFINVASCYKALDQNKEALDYYDRAFSINPNWKKGMYVNSEYGFLLVEMGELEQARETFEIMLDSKDTKARGLRSLALLNTYTGNFSRAVDHFKEAILLNKSNNTFLSEYRDRLFLAKAYLVKGMKADFLDEVNEIDSLIGKMDLSPTWLAKAGVLYARNNMV
ncbi:MAG: protein kinase domain-containing protein, partial [Candidatus Halalkalibacterium sp. M3_1C_030]